MKSDLFRGHFSLLSWKDSNPRKRNQNPMCYHYTTGQFLIATAKVVLFSILARKKSTFFYFFYLPLIEIIAHKWANAL